MGSYLDLIADSLELEFYQDIEKEFGEKFANRDSIMNSKSILQNLVYYNQWESIMENQDYYNRYAVRVSDPEQRIFQNQERLDTVDGNIYYLRSFDFENIGVDLVAEWYKRNLIIYRQILELSENQDKILVIFGQGHIRFLTQMIEDNPDLELIDPLTYLTK